MIMTLKYVCCAHILVLTFSLPVLAAESTLNDQPQRDVILVGSQSQTLRNQLKIPKQSQTMDAVLSMLGDPNQVFAVGNPKITRWSYGNMTVYFERDQVLRTVVHEPTLKTTTVATQKQ